MTALSWNAGRVITSPQGSVPANESALLERSDGSIYMNMRVVGRKTRTIASSADGGQTWSEAVPDPNLIDPECQASLVRLTEPQGQQPGSILFANPASLKRERMTVRISPDEGKTWSLARIAQPMVRQAIPTWLSCGDLTVGCLYERGEKRVYEKLTFARFNLAWLTDGKDR